MESFDGMEMEEVGIPHQYRGRLDLQEEEGGNIRADMEKKQNKGAVT